MQPEVALFAMWFSGAGSWASFAKCLTESTAAFTMQLAVGVQRVVAFSFITQPLSLSTSS